MTPFRIAVHQPAGSAAATTQQANCVIGEHAVGTAAVRDHFDVGRKGAEFPSEAVDRDGSRSGDVPGRVLGRGADVEHDHVTDHDAFRQFRAAHLV